MNLLKSLHSPLYGKISFNEPLSLHTSIKAGGPASVWVQPDNTKQLCRLIKDAKRLKISVFTIGEGCNIIFGKNGLHGICVRLDSPAFKTIEFRGTYAKAGAGVSLKNLLAAASMHSLGGYEFLSGIPGSVGGAIFGNAGAQKKAISALLTEVFVVAPQGEIRKIKKEDIKFGYRHSSLNGNIITYAAFRFSKCAKKAASSLLRKNLTEKVKMQDYTAPSAGCVFKNPNENLSAGELIDACGLKGKKIGGAQVSTKHANFIINKANATPDDIFSLIRLIQKKVKGRYGVTLEEEPKIVK